jgi:hypothetical protein
MKTDPVSTRPNFDPLRLSLGLSRKLVKIQLPRTGQYSVAVDTFLPSMENLGAAGVGEVGLIILLAALTSHRCDVVHVGLAVSR